jgi:hypothetical protein
VRTACFRFEVAEAMLRGLEMALPKLQAPFLPTGASTIGSLRREIREDFRPGEEARRETLTRSRYRRQATRAPKGFGQIIRIGSESK